MTFTLQTGTWPGCMQEGACNYDPNSMIDSGCIYGHNLTCYWDSDEDGLWDDLLSKNTNLDKFVSPKYMFDAA